MQSTITLLFPIVQLTSKVNLSFITVSASAFRLFSDIRDIVGCMRSYVLQGSVEFSGIWKRFWPQLSPSGDELGAGLKNMHSRCHSSVSLADPLENCQLNVKKLPKT